MAETMLTQCSDKFFQLFFECQFGFKVVGSCNLLYCHIYFRTLLNIFKNIFKLGT